MAPAENNSFVKLSRNILDWEWYTEPCTRALFIHCILKANWKDGSWQGQPCKRGQFITSLQKLSSETGYSVQNIKTGLKHLISTGELTSQSTNKYRIITVCNYDKYQVANKQDNKVLTINQQSTNNQLTTIEERTERKEEKEGKNNNNYSVLFERVWKEYPRKKEKSSAYKAYNTRLKEGYSEDDLLKATQNYAAECKKLGTQDRYIKLGRTFFGVNTPFTDYLKVGVENAEPERQTETEQQRREREYLEEYGTGI